MMNEQLQMEMRGLAKQVASNVRKGEYEQPIEFIMQYHGDKDMFRQYVGLIGSGICAMMYEELNDEKLSYWIKSKYEFAATARKEQSKKGIEILCGFVPRNRMKELKQYVKDAREKNKDLPPIERVCSACNIISTNLQKCGMCKCVSYCCKECQVADWKDHKKECKDIAAAAKQNNFAKK